MKKLIFITISILLVISIFINIGFFYILRFDWDWDKERLQEKTSLLYTLSNNELLNEVNVKHIRKRETVDAKLKLVDSLKTSIIDSLQYISSELITFTGGINREGNFVNPNAKRPIDKYFFMENSYRPFAYKYVHNLLSYYMQEYEKITGLKSRITVLPKFLHHYNRNSISEIFLDMTLSESITALDLIITRIEIDFYDY